MQGSEGAAEGITAAGIAKTELRGAAAAAANAVAAAAE